MAADNRKLLFNGQEISEADAFEKLKAIYGEKRAKQIPGQLADGTHRCASVAGGYIEFREPTPDELPAPAAEDKPKKAK